MLNKKDNVDLNGSTFSFIYAPQDFYFHICYDIAMTNLEGNKQEKFFPLKLNFIRETANALVEVAKPQIPESISKYAQEHGLLVKPEFHISAIAARNGKIISEKITGMQPEDAQKFVGQLESLFKKYSWEYFLADEYYLLEKFYSQAELARSGYVGLPEHTRSSLIQKAVVPDMRDFYEELRKLTGISFDLPSTHLSLFSGSDYAPMAAQGIGIYSEADFEEYKKEKIE